MTAEQILKRIEWELTVAMGPLAPVVIKDKMAEFGSRLEDFPEERLAEVVEEASFEVQNPRKKVEFQRAALKILREVPLCELARRPAEHREEKKLELKKEQEPSAGRKSRLRLAEQQGPEGRP